MKKSKWEASKSDNFDVSLIQPKEHRKNMKKKINDDLMTIKEIS